MRHAFPETQNLRVESEGAMMAMSSPRLMGELAVALNRTMPLARGAGSALPEAAAVAGAAGRPYRRLRLPCPLRPRISGKTSPFLHW